VNEDGADASSNDLSSSRVADHAGEYFFLVPAIAIKGDLHRHASVAPALY
jgi:hypothetical protein